MEQKIDLRSTLQELGIKNIFTNDADLSAMTGNTQLYGKPHTGQNTMRPIDYYIKHIVVDTNGKRNKLPEGFSMRS